MIICGGWETWENNVFKKVDKGQFMTVTVGFFSAYNINVSKLESPKWLTLYINPWLCKEKRER